MTDSIMDEIAQVSDVVHHGPIGCAERAVKDHPEHRDDILSAFASDYSSTVVARVLRGRGIDVSDYTVQRHRRGDCRCNL